ncbi:exopolysaccharide Pel transporter PelG, partial [Streptococcus orisratti]
MAGIGFSINKLVKEKNFSSKPRAFAYAAIVTIGPLLFGELVLVAVYALTNFSKVIVADRNLIVAIITYGLLASLIINGASSLVISRYLSDKLYAKKIGDILTTYWGSQLFLLTVGGLIYGIFIIFSGIGIFYSVLAWLLFCELLLSWNALNFLTILRDYQGLFKSFSLTIVTTCAMGGIFF